MSRFSPPSVFERLFGIAAGFFLAAMFVFVAVRLIEAVLPALVGIAAIGGLVLGLTWWLRQRRDSW